MVNYTHLVSYQNKPDFWFDCHSSSFDLDDEINFLIYGSIRRKSMRAPVFHYRLCHLRNPTTIMLFVDDELIVVIDSNRRIVWDKDRPIY